MNWKRDFKKGLKAGIPIGLGYIPVSFTFGFLAVSGGLPVWVAVVISLTNLTSAGQFAALSLIQAGAPLMEMAATQLVINLRYCLMSCSLSGTYLHAYSGMESGNASGRLHFYDPSPGTPKCHGNRSVCHVYRLDYSGGEKIASCAFCDSDGSGCELCSEIHTAVCLCLRRVQSNYCHSGGSGGRSLGISQQGRGT